MYQTTKILRHYAEEYGCKQVDIQQSREVMRFLFPSEK